jgi:hypothetical protein
MGIVRVLQSSGYVPVVAPHGDGGFKLDVFSRDWNVPPQAQLLIVHALRSANSLEKSATWTEETAALGFQEELLRSAVSAPPAPLHSESAPVLPHVSARQVSERHARRVAANLASNRSMGLPDFPSERPVTGGYSAEAIESMHMLQSVLWNRIVDDVDDSDDAAEPSGGEPAQ